MIARPRSSTRQPVLGRLVAGALLVHSAVCSPRCCAAAVWAHPPAQARRSCRKCATMDAALEAVMREHGSREFAWHGNTIVYRACHRLVRTRPHPFVNNTATCVQWPCVCVRACMRASFACLRKVGRQTCPSRLTALSPPLQAYVPLIRPFRPLALTSSSGTQYL